MKRAALAFLKNNSIKHSRGRLYRKPYSKDDIIWGNHLRTRYSSRYSFFSEDSTEYISYGWIQFRNLLEFIVSGNFLTKSYFIYWFVRAPIHLKIPFINTASNCIFVWMNLIGDPVNGNYIPGEIQIQNSEPFYHLLEFP